MDLPVVPAPVRAERREGRPFRMTAATRVVVGDDPGAISAAVLLAGRMGHELGDAVVVTHGDPPGEGAREGTSERVRDDVVELRIAVEPAQVGVPRTLAPELAAEAYRLEVDAGRVVVTALDAQGLLRGLATLEQIARPGEPGVLVPPVLVVDHPRYAWRGLCVDVARHWFGPDVLRRVVGLAYALKLNRLHLHLTDDQGWRIEVPSHPALTEVSGATEVGGGPGGYLTVAQYEALTTFAAARGVTVVPEVDLPGHVNAALHALPELTPGGQGKPAYTGATTGFSRLHLELPATLPFVRDVLGAVSAATPGPYVHVGGDDALTMHATEYTHLVGHAAAVVARAGKRVVAWQEAARAGLPPGSLLQVWDEDGDLGPVRAAVEAGARLVVSPASRVYLDMRYGEASPGEIGGTWAGSVDLRRAYAWDPGDVVGRGAGAGSVEAVAGVGGAGGLGGAVAGVEAAIWTENVRTEEHLFTLLLPRLAAVAEVAWSLPERRDFGRFTARLGRLTPRWDGRGIAWFREALPSGR